MGIYYYKLWNLMNKKGITQKEVSVKAHISTATLTKMRNNETVSLDVLDRIRELLDCDFGDLITAVPQPNSIEVDWKNESSIAQANGVYRIALKNYMHRNELTAANISEASSLALNTVKDFLKGKDLSSRSVLKLMRLGEQFNLCVNNILSYNQNCKKVYCAHSCGRSKTCMGYRTQYIPETGKYDSYCLYDFVQTLDADGELIAAEECPHPKNTKEMAEAIEKYGSHLHGEVVYIPAKNEQSI